MHTLTLPGGVVTLHDSPRTIPESRRVEHDYYALVESGVGSTMEDIDRHFEPMIALIGGNPDDMVTAINNTRFLFAQILERQVSARSLAFCCLVATVDGEPWTDFSPDGVDALSRGLSDKGLTDELITEHWQTVKKNSMLN